MEFFFNDEAFAVRGASEARHPGEPNQDEFLVLARNGQLRAAVIDGRWPHPDLGDLAPGIDGGVYAAQAVRCALHGQQTLRDCLQAANEHLHPLGLTPWSPQACTMAVDWLPSGRLLWAGAGDCQLWGEEGDGSWTALQTGQQMMTARSHDNLQAAKRAHMSTYWRDVWRLYEDLVDADEGWLSAPLGRLSHAQLQTGVRDGLRRVLLATAGLALDEERVWRLGNGERLRDGDGDQTWLLLSHSEQRDGALARQAQATQPRAASEFDAAGSG